VWESPANIVFEASFRIPLFIRLFGEPDEQQVLKRQTDTYARLLACCPCVVLLRVDAEIRTFLCPEEAEPSALIV
jgi:hypothetical protein